MNKERIVQSGAHGNFLATGGLCAPLWREPQRARHWAFKGAPVPAEQGGAA